MSAERLGFWSPTQRGAWSAIRISCVVKVTKLGDVMTIIRIWPRLWGGAGQSSHGPPLLKAIICPHAVEVTVRLELVQHVDYVQSTRLAKVVNKL